MSDDADPKPAQPFARKPAAWGRPPPTVFRAGPLPKGGRLPPLPEAPRPAPALTRPASGFNGPRGGIFGGSLVPQAAPESRRASPEPETTTPVADSVAAPNIAAEPIAPIRSAPEPDLTVRPLPPAGPPVVAPVAAEPELELALETPPPVSPALIAATARRKPSGRLPLYAGLVAVLVAGVAAGAWWMNRSSTPVAPTTVPTAAAVVPAPIEAVAVPPAAPPATVPVAAPPAVPAASSPAPVLRPTLPVSTAARPAAPARTAPATPARVAPAPTASVSPPPLGIQTTPLVIVPTAPAPPPPTAAQPSAADPDAPVQTRPQPLDN